MAEDAEAVVEAVMDAAKSGDIPAARLVLDRVCPPRKGRAVTIDLPVAEKPEDLVAGQTALVAAMAAGELTPEEAVLLSDVLENRRRSMESLQLEQRIAEMERRMSEDR